jgi:hypothetical protein
MDPTNLYIVLAQPQPIRAFRPELPRQNTVVHRSPILDELTEEISMNTRICTMVSAALVAGIVCVFLLLQWRQETALEESTLASIYSYPDIDSSQGIDLRYVSLYRFSWLEFFVKSRLTESGTFECPGGQTSSKPIEDAHQDAYKLIRRLENLPLQQRRKAFNLLQMSAESELATVGEQSRQ